MNLRATLPGGPWPKLPRTAQDWMALDELTSGRHLIADIGWVCSRRERAVAAGVTELPAPLRNVDDGLVKLPAVTVVGSAGRLQMFRLSVPYLVAIRRVFAEVADVGDLSVWRQGRLPCYFVIGDRETVWLRLDGERASLSLN